MEISALNNLLWRVCRVTMHTSRFGDQYRVVTLSRTDQFMDVYIWPNARVDETALVVGGVVQATFQARMLGDRQYLSVQQLSAGAVSPGQWLELLPRALCHDWAALDVLRAVVDDLPYAALRQFVDLVLARDIGAAFVTNPASFSFHHSEPSGLLSHSLDVVHRFRGLAIGFSEEQVAVGTVAALLHDVGKAKTLDINGRKTSFGEAANHEAYTLELCAEAFRHLDFSWPWAAQALRRNWAWRVGGGVNWKDQPLIAIVIAAADRVSAEFSNQNKPDLPPYQKEYFDAAR